MHILVVEDEKRLAHLLRRVLLEERHTVDLAYDGPGGLDLALSDTYDLVVLDVMLPGMDGIEICRQMRAERIMAPVLMLTARGAIEDRVTGLNVGADDYLTKPFAMEELLARINALLRRRDRRFEETPQLTVGDLTLDLVRGAPRRARHRVNGQGVCAARIFNAPSGSGALAHTNYRYCLALRHGGAFQRRRYLYSLSA
jgi:DNA-binding response OmpR family regulator